MHLKNGFHALESVLNYAMPVLLFLLPAAMAFRYVEAQHAEEKGIHAEWSGLLIVLLLGFEVYLAIFYVWFRWLSRQKNQNALKWIQLSCIFIFGVFPAILLLFPAFFGS